MVDKSIFAETKYFIIDMDGTFYLGNKLIDGSDKFIEKLRETGRDFRFFTNNSSNSEKVCCDKLIKMGFDATEDMIIVSSQVTATYLNKTYPGKSVYLLGNKNLYDCFERNGIKLTDTSPDIVVLGFDTDLTYERIYKAANFIAEGALYIATHPDKNCPMLNGFMPDTGSMIELFAASTGKRPLVTGKPMTETVDYITDALSCRRSEIAFVGDRLETDIAIGENHGIPCALVYSGVTTPEMYAASDIKASVAVKDLAELREYL
ncbi:MAG: HAD-IIA family hydrolase [Clostridiales bacterium]|nr:HAD-IIA family hydrolase [Clostridiales bacterium]